MGNKIKYLALIVTASIEFLTVRVWFSCKSFTDLFHYSSVNLKLQLEDYQYTEKGTSLFLTRLFNNKIIDSLLDLLRFYLQFWDIRFGANWFSLIGYFGILSGFYYLLSNKKKHVYHWVILFLILLLPFVEIFIEPAISLMMKSIYLWLPFSIFSLYGIYQFLTHGKTKKRYLVLLIIALVSLWWIIFLPYAMTRYCSR